MTKAIRNIFKRYRWYLITYAYRGSGWYAWEYKEIYYRGNPEVWLEYLRNTDPNHLYVIINAIRISKRHLKTVKLSYVEEALKSNFDCETLT